MADTQPSPGESQYHIIGGDGGEYGPVKITDLKSWSEQGRLDAQTMIRRENESRWQPAAQLPEVQPLLGLNTAPTMPPVMAPPHAYLAAPQPQTPEEAAKAEKARKLVIASHILGYGGLVVLFFGSFIVGYVFHSEMAGIITGMLGLISSGVGAVIGQIGRAMQGRAI